MQCKAQQRNCSQLNGGKAAEPADLAGGSTLRSRLSAAGVAQPAQRSRLSAAGVAQPAQRGWRGADGSARPAWRNRLSAAGVAQTAQRGAVYLSRKQ